MKYASIKLILENIRRTVEHASDIADSAISLACSTVLRIFSNINLILALVFSILYSFIF